MHYLLQKWSVFYNNMNCHGTSSATITNSIRQISPLHVNKPIPSILYFSVLSQNLRVFSAILAQQKFHLSVRGPMFKLIT